MVSSLSVTHPLLVVGSVALDSVITPFGKATEVLGGSATYFSAAASFFTRVRLVGVIGFDFPKRHMAFLRGRGIDVRGLQKMPVHTFRWTGRYEYDFNEAHTIETRLNVFESFRPRIPEEYRDTPFVFLANIDPDLQLEVLQQVRRLGTARALSRADLLVLEAEDFATLLDHKPHLRERIVATVIQLFGQGAGIGDSGADVRVEVQS